MSDTASGRAPSLRSPGASAEASRATVEGLPDLSQLGHETELRVGGITLRVNGEAEPCTHIGEMLGVDDVVAFQASLAGRRGATCTVIAVDGRVRIGDAVVVLPARVRV